MFGQPWLLPAAPGQFHKTTGATHRIPQRLVNERQIGGVGVERVVSINGIPREVAGISDDEEGE